MKSFLLISLLVCTCFRAVWNGDKYEEEFLLPESHEPMENFTVEGSEEHANLVCCRIDGDLKQIDAGNGQVFGVDEKGMVYTRNGGQWNLVPGTLSHVTVGPAGVWGVDKNYAVYRMLGGSWASMAGLLKQIDAGGDGIVSGVNRNDYIFCAQHKATISTATYDSPQYHNLKGKLKYYSCGPHGCWGVNSNGSIFFRTKVTPTNCVGSKWKQIRGGLSMIEVGTDGSVYGVNPSGKLYRRDGITPENPTGTEWTHINIWGHKFKHVTTDLGQVWLITNSNQIVQCQ